ncbi:hypothetical protein OQA88_5754 [Cercophora sp. LCS_1]
MSPARKYMRAIRLNNPKAARKSTKSTRTTRNPKLAAIRADHEQGFQDLARASIRVLEMYRVTWRESAKFMSLHCKELTRMSSLPPADFDQASFDVIEAAYEIEKDEARRSSAQARRQEKFLRDTAYKMIWRRKLLSCGV